MDAQARRQQIMQKLWRQKQASIVALAGEFGVSERTIQRDIAILSLEHPIYVERGRYSGGAYLVETTPYKSVRMDAPTLTLLQKMANTPNGTLHITPEEKERLQQFLRNNGF